MSHSSTCNSQLLLCAQCDWVVDIAHLQTDECACCPRCGRQLASGRTHAPQNMVAWALAALFLLALVFCFDFLSFETRGLGHVMSFVGAMAAFTSAGYPALALLFILTTVVFPGVYLLCIAYVGLGAGMRRSLPMALPCARLARISQKWMMGDVFIVGVLVALVKIVSLATIVPGPSFVVFCGYALLLLKTTRSVDWPGIWDAIARPTMPPASVQAGQTGRAQRVVACSSCQAVLPAADAARCPRCGARHWMKHISRLQLTWALLATALMLYIPANVLPIMRTHTLIGSSGHTIAGGILQLIAVGSWPIALIILCASIVIPLTKIVALAWLCLCSHYNWQHDNQARFRLLRFIERIGRWSMIDVFVVAILAALVQASPLLWIQPGPAVLSFAAVVVTTMLATMVFDPRSLWHDRTRSSP